MHPEPCSLALPDTACHAASVLGIDLPATLDGFCERIDLYEQVLRGVARECVNLPGQLGCLMQAGEHDEAQRRLHSFKGLSATVGLRRISALAAAAEKSVGQPASAADLQALMHAMTFIQPQLFILLGVLAPMAHQQMSAAAAARA